MRLLATARPPAERATSYGDWYRIGAAGLSPWTGSAGSSPSRLPIVYGCVSLLVQRAQLLPPRVVDDDGMEMRVPRWIRYPAPLLDWTEFVSAAIWSLLMDGNWYLLPVRDDAGRPQRLVVPHPAQVQPSQTNDGIITYYVDGKQYDDELIHVRYITIPGAVRGLSAIEAARQAVNIGERSQDLVLRHFSQGAQLQHVVSLEGEVGERGKMEISAQLDARWSGPENAWRPVILDGGAKLVPVNMTAEQAQYLQLSQWTDARIAGQIFHVDPTLLGIVQPGSQLTYSNAVDREANLWRDGVRPLVRRLETTISGLLPIGQSLEMDERALLTGAPRDRAAMAVSMARVNQSAKSWVYTADDLRAVTGHAPLGAPPEPLAGTPTGETMDDAAVSEMVESMMESDGDDTADG